MNLLDIQTILVFLMTVLAIWLYRSTRLPSLFPPGPRPMPIIGNLLAFGADSTKVVQNMTKLKDTYGPIVGLKLGSIKTVLLGSAEVAKEALVQKAQDFNDRPHVMQVFTDMLKRGGKVRGVAWTNGDLWRDSRRFSLSSMRDFGLGKRSMEERMYDEANVVCDVIAAAAGRSYNLLGVIRKATSNIICSVCFGSRFEYTNPDFLHMMKCIDTLGETDMMTSLQNFLPILRYLPGTGTDFKQLDPVMKDIDEFIEEQIDQHRATYDPENPRDFVDLYLAKESEGHLDDGAFSKDNLLVLIRDLFAAGTETSGTAIRWLLLYMIRFPEIQHRCQKELDHVVGSGRHPTLADRPQLPYIEAVINEMFRHANVASILVPHVAARDTTLGGYKIPQDTMVMVNLAAINMDPLVWEDPQAFNPDRWLAPDGSFRKRESMPFGAGPRMCLGESLARAENFVFFSFLMQRFTFQCVDPGKPPSLEAVFKAVNAPHEYELIATAK